MLNISPNEQHNAPISAPATTPVFTEQSDAEPAPPTTPLTPEGAAPEAAAPTPTYPSYYGSFGSTAGYGATPPPPQYTTWEPAPQRPQRRWMGPLVTVGLLLALAIGAGGGSLITARALGGQTSSGSTVVLGAKSAPAVTVSSNITTLQQNIETVAKAVEPSVVEVTSTGGTQAAQAIGSGDILTADGYIVTNDHVVQGFSSFTVTLWNGTNKQATLVGQDAQDDLAVLKISATNLKPIAFADSSKAQVGEFSIAIGSPLGVQNSATFGIISGLNRTASEAPSGPAGELIGLVQTSAPINPGNSGGALVNLQGQLVGIPTLSATNPETGSSANSIGYAIPSNRVSYVTAQIIAHGGLTSSGQGFIGIEAQNVTPQVAAANNLSTDNGVLVVGFTNDAAGASPAQQAGLKSGDVITAVDGQTVNSNDDLASALLSDKPGAHVTLTITRGSSQQNISVTLGERPVSTQG